jgi:hypothetical protein
MEQPTVKKKKGGGGLHRNLETPEVESGVYKDMNPYESYFE